MGLVFWRQILCAQSRHLETGHHTVTIETKISHYHGDCPHSYLYVLQLCIDIRENRVLVDGDDASHLASLLLQGTSFSVSTRLQQNIHHWLLGVV